jgi:hypothetical protein
VRISVKTKDDARERALWSPMQAQFQGNLRQLR